MLHRHVLPRCTRVAATGQRSAGREGSCCRPAAVGKKNNVKNNKDKNQTVTAAPSLGPHLPSHETCMHCIAFSLPAKHCAHNKCVGIAHLTCPSVSFIYLFMYIHPSHGKEQMHASPSKLMMSCPCAPCVPSPPLSCWRMAGRFTPTRCSGIQLSSLPTTRTTWRQGRSMGRRPRSGEWCVSEW